MMKRPLTAALGPGLFAAAVFFLLFACAKTEGAGPRIGDASPRFTLAALDGSSVTIPDDLRGRPVVVHFWADWCPYCVQEMPALELLYREYRKNGLTVYAVNVGQNVDAALAFAKRVGVSYPVLLDPDGRTAKQYHVLGLPRTFFLDRDGRIKHKLLGEASNEMLRKLTQDIL